MNEKKRLIIAFIFCIICALLSGVSIGYILTNVRSTRQYRNELTELREDYRRVTEELRSSQLQLTDSRKELDASRERLSELRTETKRNLEIVGSLREEVQILEKYYNSTIGLFSDSDNDNNSD